VQLGKQVADFHIGEPVVDGEMRGSSGHDHMLS
jgi:hypothetical protein